MSLGRSSRFCSLASLRWNLSRCYLPLHLHHPSSFIMVASCVTGPLTRMLVKPWWIWKCSSSWEHAQAQRVIISTNWDSSQFPRQCYDLYKQWIHSLLLGSSPVTRIIPSICILFPACTANVSFYHGSLPFPVISKNHPLRCLQQGNPHHPSLSMPFYRPPPNDRLWFALSWYKEFQWSLNQR